MSKNYAVNAQLRKKKCDVAKFVATQSSPALTINIIFFVSHNTQVQYHDLWLLLLVRMLRRSYNGTVA